MTGTMGPPEMQTISLSLSLSLSLYMDAHLARKSEPLKFEAGPCLTSMCICDLFSHTRV
jgi:hypothetical protein